MTALKDILLQYDIGLLRDLAAEHGVDFKGLVKNALVGALARRLATRDRVERALSRLTALEREVVFDIQRGGEEVLVDQLDQLLLRKKLVSKSTPSRDRWERNERVGNPNYRAAKPRLEDVAAHLLSLGLVFTRFHTADTSYHYVLTWQLGDYLVIPPEILTHVPAGGAAVVQAPEPERVEPGSARNLQRDLSRYAAFVRRSGSLALTTQGWVYKKVLTELLQSLGRTDIKKADEKNNPYLFFLRRLLTALDLLRSDTIGKMAHPEPTVFYPNEDTVFWSRTPAERIRLSYEAYLSTTAWNELRVPAGSLGHDQRHPAPREMIAGRRLVIDFVKRRGGFGWVSLADLVDDIRLGAYDFLFSRQGHTRFSYAYMSPYNSYSNPYGITYRDIGKESEGWDKVEGAIIRHIITGPLHWMGLVDIGLGEDSEPAVYRLNAVGQWLIEGGAPVNIEEEGGRVVVQPNFQIIALEPLSENVLMSLDEFAQFEGGDHALTYRLSRESVYRAQRTGWDAARVIRYLENETHAPLPQNIHRSLEEWQAQHERITFRRGVSLLQAEDAAALESLFADPALATRLGRRVAADVALHTADAHALAAALRDANWSPVITRPGETTAPASVVADDAGNIEFIHRTPSIYAYAGIEPFAERIDARHARITPESVEAARERSISVPRILDQLRNVHRGEIPTGLVQRIKAWGKYYGDARMGNLILIEFRDDKVRTELLADPELAVYLTRFDAGPRALAVVNLANIERIKELLAARGITVREFKS